MTLLQTPARSVRWGLVVAVATALFTPILAAFAMPPELIQWWFDYRYGIKLPEVAATWITRVVAGLLTGIGGGATVLTTHLVADRRPGEYTRASDQGVPTQEEPQ